MHNVHRNICISCSYAHKMLHSDISMIWGAFCQVSGIHMRWILPRYLCKHRPVMHAHSHPCMCTHIIRTHTCAHSHPYMPICFIQILLCMQSSHICEFPASFPVRTSSHPALSPSTTEYCASRNGCTPAVCMWMYLFMCMFLCTWMCVYGVLGFSIWLHAGCLCINAWFACMFPCCVCTYVRMSTCLCMCACMCAC
jgi:hypothetical protein